MGLENETRSERESSVVPSDASVIRFLTRHLGLESEARSEREKRSGNTSSHKVGGDGREKRNKGSERDGDRDRKKERDTK